MEEAYALATLLSQRPRGGLAVTKRTLDAQLAMALPEALAWDAKVQAECMRDPDFHERRLLHPHVPSSAATARISTSVPGSKSPDTSTSVIAG